MIKVSTSYRILRFLIAGGIVAAVNVGVLFFCVQILDMYYVWAVGAAFVISLPVSFLLQKLWTFKNNTIHTIPHESLVYTLVQTFNLLLDMGGVFVFVHFFSMWYIAAQVIMFVVLAIESYVVFQWLFRETPTEP